MKHSRTIGAVLQGVVLGLLMLWAIAGILNSYGGARLFRYQGF